MRPVQTFETDPFPRVDDRSTMSYFRQDLSPISVTICALLRQ